MSLLEVFGIEQKFSLLGNPDTALFVIILMGGVAVRLLYAGLFVGPQADPPVPV